MLASKGSFESMSKQNQQIFQLDPDMRDDLLEQREFHS